MVEPNEKDKQTEEEKLLITDDLNTLLYVLHEGRLAGYTPEFTRTTLIDIEKDLLICPVCKGFIKNAHFNNLDNSTYCYECIDNKTNLLPNVKINSSVLCHKIICPISSRGCKWQGTIDELINKHALKCLHLIIACYLNCGLIMYRKKENDHIANFCINRILTCQYCGFQDKAHTFDPHYDICIEYPIDCPLECPKTIRRKEKEHHVESICEMSLIQCLYADIGCNVGTIKRGDLDAHNKDGYLYHAEYLLSMVHKDHETINQLSEKLSFLETKCNTLSEKLTKTRTEVEFYKERTHKLELEKNDLCEKFKLNELLTESGLCWHIENISGLIEAEFLSSKEFFVSTYTLLAEAQVFRNGNIAIHIKRLPNQESTNFKNPIQCNCQTVLVNRNNCEQSWREERLAVNIRTHQKLVTISIIPKSIYTLPEYSINDSIIVIIRINLI